MINGIGWVETNNSSGFQPFIFNNFSDHDLSLIKEFLGFLTNSCIIEDFRISSVWVFTTNLP
jgi:hypothetical protein